MLFKYRITACVAGLLAALLVAPAWGSNVNKSITIGPNTETDGASSVNGSISIGAGATVTGSVETVNGTIRIDDDARVEDAETVNGSLRIGDRVYTEDLSSVNGAVKLGEDVTVDGEVSVVNGQISVGSGSSVRRDVSNVNGQIKVTGSTVGGDLRTVTGDVYFEDGAVLKGNLTVEKPHSWRSSSDQRIPTVVIGPGSRVEGEIILEQKVKLYVSETARVGGVSGVMTMADAERFKGTRP